MNPNRLSFEQREGLSALPSQLQRGEISRELRAKLWACVYDAIRPSLSHIYQGHGQWYEILRDVHVERAHRRVDQFRASQSIEQLGATFDSGSYDKVYGWLDFVIQHSRCPGDLAKRINVILVNGRSAYRIIGGVIAPLGSEQDAANFERSLQDTSVTTFSGAHSHLRQAASKLTNGSFADSVRESISAVESVARVLEPSGEFSKALQQLENKIAIHPALKKGFSAIYGYTSDQQGIRHALLDSAEAVVDETDAIFFLGACASFVSYLIGKSRAAGLA